MPLSENEKVLMQIALSDPDKNLDKILHQYKIPADHFVSLEKDDRDLYARVIDAIELTEKSELEKKTEIAQVESLSIEHETTSIPKEHYKPGPLTTMNVYTSVYGGSFYKAGKGIAKYAIGLPLLALLPGKWQEKIYPPAGVPGAERKLINTYSLTADVAVAATAGTVLGHIGWGTITGTIALCVSVVARALIYDVCGPYHSQHTMGPIYTDGTSKIFKGLGYSIHGFFRKKNAEARSRLEQLSTQQLQLPAPTEKEFSDE